MRFRGKRLGILLSTSPAQPGFQHGLRLATEALSQGIEVYLYCLDDAVAGLDDPQLQGMRLKGMRLFACAFAARQRHVPLRDQAIFSGLTVLNDLMTSTDRFVSFNS